MFIINYLVQNTVGRLLKKLVIDVIWGAVLHPVTMGIFWSVSQIAMGVVNLVYGFFTLPPIYNFFTDIARIPIGMADSLDAVINALVGFSHNPEVGKVCTKCNLLSGKKYVRTFFENAVTISLLAYLTKHFIDNANKVMADFKNYNDARHNAGVGLESYAQNSYFAVSTMWLCVGAQGIAISACALSALSANQFPRNKFMLAGTLCVSELIMRGFSGLIKSSVEDLNTFKSEISKINNSKSEAEMAQNIAEENLKLCSC